MGFLDKTINRTKSSFGTTSNKVSESREVSKIESQIKEERNKVKSSYETIGKEYYRYTVDGDESHKENFDKLIAGINESRRLIEEYEQQIEDIRAAAKEERENIRAQEEARRKEIEAEEEAARAEKERQKKENDDLF